MILVLSQDSQEPSTEEVVDWVRALGGDAVRLNGDDLTAAHPFRLELDGAGPHLRFRLDGRDFTDRDVRVVWLRRWGRSGTLGVRTVPGLETLAARITGHLSGEVNAVSRALFSFFHRARWLTRPEDAGLSKLAVLRAAVEAGLEIPATLVTNDRAEIERFRRAHGRIITKSVGEAEVFSFFGTSYGLYTAEAAEDEVAALPETVFPSLVQALVEKAFEVRAFYLAGDLYAMAIFSQADEQTAVDFRHYNRDRPNRSVPYRLPDEVAEKLRALMRAVGLETGSLDLIRTPDGRHVFLEVNPAGQFGMVSHPCNYRLEKKVAEHLIRESRHGDD
ncbi:MAG TPA: grasp-with-spasm system ATP-grasp peptide maturase [Longimicrobiaceae bacterium]|nr:grasp-with-spasm system ATP-grasp peptide maturase [Longimicrobiaceae bacterium]